MALYLLPKFIGIVGFDGRGPHSTAGVETGSITGIYGEFRDDRDRNEDRNSTSSRKPLDSKTTDSEGQRIRRSFTLTSCRNRTMEIRFVNQLKILSLRTGLPGALILSCNCGHGSGAGLQVGVLWPA